MKKNLFLAAIFSLFVFAVTASAQIADHSGTWKLDVSKSKLGEFGVKQQTELRDKILEWSATGATCMLSNSTAPIIYDLYKDFDIQTIDAARAITQKVVGAVKSKSL